MFLARVYVSLKPTVNDPEGLTIHGALKDLGFETIESVRAGKYFEVRFEADDEAAADRDVRRMCDELLANPVIDQYRYELEQLESVPRR